MPAAVPILIAVTAAAATASAVQNNQQIQHAKGAAEANATANIAQAKDLAAKDKAAQDAKATQGAVNQGSAMAAIRAAMTAGSGMGGTILSGASGGAPAPTQTKQLLGA